MMIEMDSMVKKNLLISIAYYNRIFNGAYNREYSCIGTLVVFLEVL